VPVSSPQASPGRPAPAPSLLPSCLQTWVKLTQCKDNSDSDCFCKDSHFTTNVQQCISAWSNHEDQEQGALSYLAGICAPHIPANPGIVLNVPSGMNLAPMPPWSSSPAQPSLTSAPTGPATLHMQTPETLATGGTEPPATPAPQTVVSVSTTVTIPCPYGTSGGVLESGSSMASCATTTVINTAVTVPQVAFTTSQSAVGLIAGTPTPAAAPPTSVGPPVPAGANVNGPISSAQSGVGANPPIAGLGGNLNSPVAAPAPVGSVAPITKPSNGVVPFTGGAVKSGSSTIFMSIVVAVAGFAVFT